MRIIIGVALGVGALSSGFGAAPAAAQQLSAEEVSAVTSGKVHRGANPRGGQFVFKYAADGSLQGVMQMLGNKGVAVQRRDQGHWSIAGNKLCVQWNKWRNGSKHCGPISKDGGGYHYGSGVRFSVD